MKSLRTTVLLKTDIAGSTPKFRALLAADLQSLLSEHRALVAHLAAEQNGRIFRAAGDGYWLEFPSATGAAKAAIAMQEALRLAQLSKGDDRLSLRVVIGLGDVGDQDGDLMGDVLALVTRLEAVTPADEIYLTLGARLALKTSEIQTALVDAFLLKGFPEPTPVYRVEHRHRTHVIPDAYILMSDLRGFVGFTRAASVSEIECLLDALDALVRSVAIDYGGAIRFAVGDAHCITFGEASQALLAAERIGREWEAAVRGQSRRCAINIALHRGAINAFRSFLYGEGIVVASLVLHAFVAGLAANEGGVVVTNSVRDDPSSGPWHNRFDPAPLTLKDARLSGIEVYRLD